MIMCQLPKDSVLNARGHHDNEDTQSAEVQTLDVGVLNARRHHDDEHTTANS